MANYTDYQQRALYGAGQSAARAGQRFLMEREALERGDKAAAKYHRSRANALNRQGAFAAVRGMGGNEGANQYFPVTSDGQPIQSGSGIALSSAGRDIFDKFRQQGFVKPIREKKRYAPNTEPKGLGFLIDKIASNTLGGKILSSMGNKKPKPDDAYYKSLWGQGLNEMYEPSGIFKSGEFLGNEKIDPYYERPYTGPKWAEGFLKPFVQPRSDAFGVVRDSSIPEDWEFMQEKPLDALSYKYGIADLVSDDIKNEEINSINEIANSGEGIFYGGRGELKDSILPPFDDTVTEIPTDEELESTYYYILKDNAYSEMDDAWYGNSTIMADHSSNFPSLEQWKEAHRRDKNYIDSILASMEAGEKMGFE